MLSAAIWNATSILLPYLGEGPEQVITREFVSRLGDTCEAYSSSLWNIDAASDAAPPDVEVKLAALKTGKFDPAELEKRLSDAAGPNNSQGQTFGNPNPHWPNANANWVSQFASRAAQAIAAEVNKAVPEIGPALQNTEKQIETILKKHVSTLTNWVS